MKKFLIFPIIFLFSGCVWNHSSNEIIYSHQLSRGYNTVYPPSEKLFYYKIQVDKIEDSTVFFKFYFVNTCDEFMHYEFKQDNNDLLVTKEGEYIVKFNKNVTVNTYSNITINVVTQNNESHLFEMQLSFDPKIVPEINGRSGAKDGLLIRKTNILFLEIAERDFILCHPNNDEKKFIRDEFGKKLNAAFSEKEKINALAVEVIDLLELYRGIPSNEMDTLSAVEQLMKLKLQKDKIWCGNIAEIFITVCACFDIPAREVGLGNTYNDTSEIAIFHSDYHATTEVYDKDKKSWTLVDLSFYLLGARTKDERTLNFVDFLYLLNSPSEQKNIFVSEYDHELKKIRDVNILEAKNYSMIMDYYKQNQKFYFPHKNGYFSF